MGAGDDDAVETNTIRHTDGTTSTLELYAKAGQIGMGRLLDNGDLDFVALERLRTHRNPAQNGRYRPRQTGTRSLPSTPVGPRTMGR